MLLRIAKPFSPVGVFRKFSFRPPWILSSFFSYSDSSETKSKADPVQETRMRDRFILNAKGGDGGNGCCSHRRSRHDRHGRPDGGNGGRGGDVILVCSPTVWDFRGLQHHVKAAKGGHGASKNMIGTRGEDKVVQVPVGTVIHLVKGELPSVIQTNSKTDLDPWELPGSLDSNMAESNFQSVTESPTMDIETSSFVCNSSPSSGIVGTPDLITHSTHIAEGTSEGIEDVIENVAELTEPGQRIIVARGGEGGLGNLSATNIPKKENVTKPGWVWDNIIRMENKDQSSPNVGFPGSEVILVLELKSIADVGLVGMPNAGKSTLLGAISRAKPAVGHYAFTTLRPNSGKLKFDDFSITVADIPGLIKGAHENRGLGHAFLRHIERTKVLAYVVDLAAALDGKKGLPPWEQLRDLILELEHHQQGLSDRSSLVVANKIDESGAEEVYDELKRRVKGVPIYPVCAVLEEGVAELKFGLRMLVDSAKSQSLSLEHIDCSDNEEHSAAII